MLRFCGPAPALTEPSANAEAAAASNSSSRSSINSTSSSNSGTVAIAASRTPSARCRWPKRRGSAACRGRHSWNCWSSATQYNNFIDLLPAAQKNYQANWPGTGCEKGYGLIFSAVSAGAIMFAMAAAPALGALSRTGTVLDATFVSAVIFGARSVQCWARVWSPCWRWASTH